MTIFQAVLPVLRLHRFLRVNGPSILHVFLGLRNITLRHTSLLIICFEIMRIFFLRKHYLDLDFVRYIFWLQLSRCPLFRSLFRLQTFFFKHFFIEKVKLGVMNSIDNLLRCFSLPHLWNQILYDIHLGFLNHSLTFLQLRP